MKRKYIFLALLTVLFIILIVGRNTRISAYNRLLNTVYETRILYKEIRGDYDVPKEQLISDVFYQNTVLTAKENADYNQDVKKISNTENYLRLSDYPQGYYVDLPTDSTFDFTLSPDYTKVVNSTFEAIITREWSPYDDVTWYLDNYPNRYLLNEQYLKSNNITTHRNETVKINGKDVLIIGVTRTPSVQNNKPNSYIYAYFYTSGREYYRIMFKGKSYDKKFVAECEKTINSLQVIRKRGTPRYVVDWHPELPNWDEQTSKLYYELSNSTDFKWGIFTKQSMTEGVDFRIPQMEEKLDFKFDIILGYMYLYQEVPIYGMEKARDDGKAIELTIQIANMENSGLFGKNPNFDVYDGLKDDEIRRVARQLKKFGSPILLRLNNEMNSDWTNYSGIAALSDAEINKDIWIRIYNIFEEEGVTNCIWIFNPNDKNCPPCAWNSFAGYYPGNKYVHLLGVTGYNTGTYYNEKWAEKWSNFTEIFDHIEYNYKPLFSDFSWIITEFASSSYGGDKAAWIDEMFAKMPSYSNIKAAVWWSYADFDVDRPKEWIPSRPYFLDETPQTTEAFKRGVKKQYDVQGSGSR